MSIDSTKNHVLIIFNDNWADEMDLKGFKVMNPEEFKEWEDSFDKLRFPLECGYGTNEEVEYKTLESFRKCFEVKKITEEEAVRINELFGLSYDDCSIEFGQFSHPLDYLENDEDESGD